MKIYITINSSKINIYEVNQKKKIISKKEKNFDFKNIFKIFGEIKEKYKDKKIKIFAENNFYNFVGKEKQNFIYKFFEKTGIFFNILSKDLEKFFRKKSSKSEIIYGILKKEYRKVVLSGSFNKFLDYILETKNFLEKNNIKVLAPNLKNPKISEKGFVIFEGEENKSLLELEKKYFDKIEICDALIVCNKNGYVGASTFIEIGYALAKGKKVIFTETPEEFMLKNLPAEIGL